MRSRNHFPLHILTSTLTIFLIAVITIDATAHLLPLHWDYNGCDTLIIDVYGYLNTDDLLDSPKVCYRRGMTAWEFRRLGQTKANNIIIITHLFTSSESVGLGTSDVPSFTFPLLHPITTLFIIKGVTNNGEVKLAVTPSIKYISSSMDGKTVSIITCFRPEIVEFTNAFLSLNARPVIVTRIAELKLRDALDIINHILTNNEYSRVCNHIYLQCYW